MDRLAWRSMRLALLPLLDALGAAAKVDAPELEEGYWTDPDGGGYSAKRKGRVVAIGVSGRALARLRSVGMLGQFLGCLSAEPHRVTVLDVTTDHEQDAPSVLHSLYRQAAAGGVKLTRKSLRPCDLLQIMQPRQSDGVDTGTVYLGARHAEVRMKVYDKQAERLFHGVERGPGVRYEVTVKNGLPTLRDVMQPESLFWHYAQGVLPRPDGVPEWVAHGEGYALEALPLRGALELLRAKLVHSPDVRRLVELADSLPGGRAALLREIDFAFPQPLASSEPCDSEALEAPSRGHPCIA